MTPVIVRDGANAETSIPGFLQTVNAMQLQVSERIN